MNCDKEMLQQVSRMTGAQIIKHLDDITCTVVIFSFYLVLNPNEVIGNCGVFIVRDFRTVFKERKQVSYVDVGMKCLFHHRHMQGSIVVPLRHLSVLNVVIYLKDVVSLSSFSSLGTVCLRGADSDALHIVKRILLYLIQVRLSLDREIAFYMNMGITSTPLLLEKEPTLYAPKPRVLASSPNIIFGKYRLFEWLKIVPILSVPIIMMISPRLQE